MAAPLNVVGLMQYPEVPLNYVTIKGRSYLCNDREPMMRHDIKSLDFLEAGMLPPVYSPNVAAVGGGALTGAYVYLLTEYDIVHDLESDPGPAMEITLAAQSVTFTNFPEPRNAYTTHYRLYRALSGVAYATPEIAAANTDRTIAPMAMVIEVPTFPPPGAQNDNMIDDDVRARMFSYGISYFNGQPPVFAYPLFCRGRLFLWGQSGYNADTVDAVNGSQYLIPGPNARLNRGVIGQRIVVNEGADSYEVVDYLDGSPLALEIDIGFRDASGIDLSYHTYPEDGKLAWSQADKPESFPPANHRFIAKGQGVHGTGIGKIRGFPLLFAADKTWLLQYGEDPGQMNMTQEQQLSGSVGCVSHRSIQTIQTGAGERTAWLSRFGIAATGGQGVEVVSDPPNYPGGMRPYFDNLNLDAKGEAQVACAANYKSGSLYLCGIPTENSNGGCDEVVVWDYELNNFWIWKFPWEIYWMASTEKFVKDLDDDSIIYRREIIIMGTSAGYLMYWPANSENDGASRDDTEGTLEGTVTSADANSLTDSAASFMLPGSDSPPSLMGLEGAYVTVEDSDGTLQHKLITFNDANTISVDSWDWTPEEGDSYWIGEIENYYKLPKLDFNSLISMKTIRDIHLIYDIEDQGELGIACYEDQNPAAMTLEDGDTVDLTGGIDSVTGRTLTRKQRGRARLNVNSRSYNFQVWMGNRRPNQPWTVGGMAMNFEARVE